MNVVISAACFLFLLAAPIMSGVLLELLFGIKKYISSLYLTGLLFFWAVFSLQYLAAAATGASVEEIGGRLMMPWIIVLLALVLCFFFPGKRKKLTSMPAAAAEKLKEKKELYLCCGAVFVLLAVCMMGQPSQMHEPMYDGAERTALLVTDGRQTPIRELATVDPLTGLQSPDADAGSLSACMLPAFYASLCYITGMSHTALLGTIIPLWVLFVTILGCCHGVKALLGRVSLWTVAIFGLAALFAASAYRNPFFDLLHLPYEARTWVAFFLLPEVIVILDRKGELKRGSVIVMVAGCMVLLFVARSMGGLYAGVLPVALTGLLWEICKWISSRIF